MKRIIEQRIFGHANPEMAPDACIVCGRARPDEPGDPEALVYLANARPLGAMACQGSCLTTALERHKKTGRVDQ